MKPPPSTSTGSPSASKWQPPSLTEMQALLPQYQFLALIGRGGMGAVYKATQLSLNRPVAIKVLPGDLMNDAEENFAARFRQESLTMAKLNHPGIVSVYECGEAGGLLYIVMEFIDGTDVARMIQSEGKLAPELVTNLLAQVCDALHYAHKNGVIHRDIKPANLLITREGQVKIADFGLAKHNDEALIGLTKTNVAIGTPDFLAPEAWTPGTTLDARADLYSLGVTLYQMLTGEVPRGLWKMPSVKVGVDPRFDAIIDKAMQPEREARYQSSGELRRDLDQIQAGAGENLRSAEHRSAGSEPSVIVPSDARRSEASPRVRRLATALIVLAAILAVVIAVLLLWPRPPEQNSAAASRKWIVTTVADSGAGSLRQAVANSTNDSTITFAAHLSGSTILLTSGQLVLDKNLTIDASALPDGIQINGNRSGRIFQVTSNATVALDSLTLTNGLISQGDGGGIHNFGFLTVKNCTVAGNSTDRSGGGIFNRHGTLRVVNSTFTHNSARGSGGAIASWGAPARFELIHSTISGNHCVESGRYWGGGGIYSWSSTALLTNSIIAGNTCGSGIGPDFWHSTDHWLAVGSCLVGNAANSHITNGVDGNLTGVSALLAPLGRHGGPTPTMPPLQGSPALDAAVGSDFTTDQRGFPRPVGTAPDIGAVEGVFEPTAARSPARRLATVREAARWLVKERADFKVLSAGREIDVKTEQDIPAGDFQIVSLWFDRWASSPPLPPPPEEEFEVMHAVKTLRYAFLRMPGLSDAPFEFLAGNTNLKTLYISGSKNVTDEVLIHLAGLKKLEQLAITHAPRLTGRDFAKSAWLGSVRELDFLYATLDDDAIRVLATCPRVWRLKVEGTAITRDGLLALVPMRTLTELSAGYCASFSEQDLVEILPKFGRLKKLEIPHAAFGDEAAGAVAALTNLTELMLSSAKMSDAGLSKLSALSRLKALNLIGTRVTAEGIAAFEKAHPECKVQR